MEQLIRFRLLADSLLQNEFDAFVQVANLNVRSLVLNGLFHSFRTQMQTDSDNTKLKETTEIISTIIRSRNAKQLKQIESLKKEPTKLSINDLPFPLIGECASFLPFIDYNSLQNVSRSVFIGCNDPNTVTKIDGKTFKRNYKSKQHLLLVKYKKVINFAIHNLSLSQDTKSLLLRGIDTKNTKKFFNMNCFNFDRIEILKIFNGAGDYDIESFCELFKHFKNIKILELGCRSILQNQGFQSILENQQFRNKIFNNLQGLAFYTREDHAVNFFNRLLHYFSDKLLSLHFDIATNITCPKNGFINLKEVCITNANYHCINNIIKTAKTLQRVHLQFYSDDVQNNGNKFEDILMDLFSQITLEFISITINENHKIKNVLQKISFSKRKRLKIRLEIRAQIENANEYFEILENKFSKDGVFDDWMVIFVFRFIEPMRKYFNQNERHNIGDTVQLVKNNKECKINGWKERWLHNCYHCV